MARYSKEAKKALIDITKEALEKLIAYDWPGNVRELGNVIERAVVLGAGTKVTVEDLPPRIAGREPTVSTETLPYRKAINAYRREVIAPALAQTQGNQAAAAKLLGLHRTHLFRLIKTLRIG